MNIFFMVNEIKMNKIWNGELIFIMKMSFCNLLLRLHPLNVFYLLFLWRNKGSFTTDVYQNSNVFI